MAGQIMTKWRQLFVESQNMSVGERQTIEAQMLTDDRRMQQLANTYREQHAVARFGDYVLYQQIMSAVEMHMFAFGIAQLRANSREASVHVVYQQVNTACTARLPFLEAGIQKSIDAATQDKTLFGSVRWLLLTREQAPTDPPVGVRMLWTTLFSALWVCSTAEFVHADLLAACTKIVGSNEMLLLSLILCTLHIHYGVLPLKMFNMLLKINTTNLAYSVIARTCMHRSPQWMSQS